MNPSGAGPQVFTRLARQKLEVPIRRLGDSHQARVGIVTGNQASDNTEAPIAIVCDFDNAVSPNTLRETQKLAWGSVAHLCLSRPSLIW